VCMRTEDVNADHFIGDFVVDGSRSPSGLAVQPRVELLSEWRFGSSGGDFGGSAFTGTHLTE
jgi:hypothetical protein